MTEDERALLDTVIAYPDSDLPRLVLADYLEETATRSMCEACDGTGVIEAGKGRQKVCAACTLGYVSDGRAERAEFIRIQCELASLGFPGPLSVAVARTVAAGHLVEHDDPAHESLVFRSCELLVQWGQSWGDHFGITLWSRGFIDEVRCRLGFWTGGRVCDHCNGYGEPDYAERPCRVCRGRGRLTGNGPGMIATHPITRVSVSDKEPASLADGVCWRENPGRENVLEVLPVGLLDGWGYTSPGGNYRRKTYESREVAYDDLSDGLIRWAKRNSSTV